MKVLDVDLFQDGIQRNIAMLERLRSETDTIYQAVLGLVEMEEQLKGVGGNAIRSFYRECHVPFLQFFRMFSESFKKVLEQMEAALHSLEPDSAGYILERFLEGELEEGLTLIGQLTASLTDETNSIMDQVSDIVSLPHLDDSGVQEGVINSKKKRNDTVTGLNVFDATQTFALNSIEQDLQAMDTWLADMEGLFKAGVKDITFVQSQWDVLTLRSHIRTELFPKVYLNPSDLWVEKQEQLIGTMITAATFQNLEGKKVTTVEEHVEENVKYHQYENGLLIKEYTVGQTVFYEVVSKVEYKQESVQVDNPKENKVLDFIQTGLDIVGLIPVVGEVADGVNGVIYSARGDALNATLSFSAMIPVVGMASTGGKLAVKGSKAIEDAQNASKAIDIVKGGSKGRDTLLLPGEGKVGTYEELIDAGTRGDNITPHHMPSAKFLQTNAEVHKNDGVSMNMEHPHPGKGGRHRQTETYGMTGKRLEDYLNLQPRNALARDIMDARGIYIKEGLYTPEIRSGLMEVIRLNKSKYPDMFDR
ncbi:T7SS effector LXG polymorphic toxin [Psychrobacillus sp. OK032]|uniref:T7SS effector LXG polymorphic toxin n=1 Tax=Psychrobacillus sp. OK032 TaxID=1884358 RepID=UPI0008C1E6A9|nr:T7SS effector LXG polymorphic toxin [Psychrobacillus sp. OK032]SES45126.1 Predicted ribonuclease, toxin component of the YeeF-YezG toxin-antitoxin module [Psychrobacillus sp. OK032]